MGEIHVVYGSCTVSGNEGVYELGIYENTIEEIKEFFEKRTRYTRGNGWKLTIYPWQPRKIQDITWFEGKKI
jgi:hypothetical protein